MFYGIPSESFDLLVVGNGFDKNLGLETDYSAFLDYVAKIHTKNPILIYLNRVKNSGLFKDKNWNSFEKVICHYLNFIEILFTKLLSTETYVNVMDQYSGEGNLINKAVYLLDVNESTEQKIKLMLKYGFASRYVSFSLSPEGITKIDSIDLFNEEDPLNEYYVKFFFNPIEKEMFSINEIKEFILNDFNTNLKNLEDELNKYIKYSTIEITEKKPKCSFKYCLSFNYSDTAQKIFNFADDNIAYIHGKVNVGSVIGIEESMIPDQIITKNGDYSEFFKITRRTINGFNKGIENKIFNKLNSNSEVVIYGHSLDKSDKTILDKIFMADLKRIIVYYYGTEEECYKKLKNLIGIDRLSELNSKDKLVIRSSKVNSLFI